MTTSIVSIRSRLVRFRFSLALAIVGQASCHSARKMFRRRPGWQNLAVRIYAILQQRVLKTPVPEDDMPQYQRSVRQARLLCPMAQARNLDSLCSQYSCVWKNTKLQTVSCQVEDAGSGRCLTFTSMLRGLGRLEHLVLTHNGMFGDVAMELAKVGRIVVTLLGVSW